MLAGTKFEINDFYVNFFPTRRTDRNAPNPHLLAFELLVLKRNFVVKVIAGPAAKTAVIPTAAKRSTTALTAAIQHL